MSRKRLTWLLVCFAIVSIAYFGWKLTSRTAYESADYRVLKSDGRFEVREYPDLMMATTSTQPESRGEDGSFMRLFRYISGKNEEEQSVAMATPVFMRSAAGSEGGEMGFVIPKDIPADHVPDPSEPGVQISKRTGGQFAVVRFSGQMNGTAIANAEQELRQWMDARKLNGEERAEHAGYDPPWTPGPLRRNEVLIRLDSP